MAVVAVVLVTAPCCSPEVSLRVEACAGPVESVVEDSPARVVDEVAKFIEVDVGPPAEGVAIVVVEASIADVVVAVAEVELVAANAELDVVDAA